MLVLVIGVVVAFEIMNSSIENLADFVTKEKNEHIKKLKDIAAAGVLVSAIMVFLIGFFYS